MVQHIHTGFRLAQTECVARVHCAAADGEHEPFDGLRVTNAIRALPVQLVQFERALFSGISFSYTCICTCMRTHTLTQTQKFVHTYAQKRARTHTHERFLFDACNMSKRFPKVFLVLYLCMYMHAYTHIDTDTDTRTQTRAHTHS